MSTTFMENKPVTIYTTQTCGYCKATKEFFQEHGVTYNEIDVTSDRNKQKEMIQRSGQMGVPVIVVGDGESEEMIIGFDQARLSESLGIAG